MAIELTKEQRKAAYQYGLNWFEKNQRKGPLDNPYLCNLMLEWMFGGMRTMHNTRITIHHVPFVMDMFPELKQQAPEGFDWAKPKVWYDNDYVGNLYRELALTKALELLDQDDLLS